METLQNIALMAFIFVWLGIFIGIPGYCIYYFITKRKLVLENDAKALTWPRGFMTFLGIVALTYNIVAHDIVFDPHYHPGIGIGIMMSIVAGGLWMMMPKKDRTWVTHSSTLVTMLAFFTIAFRANGFVHGLNYFIGITSLTILWLQFAAPEWIVRLGWGVKTFFKNIPQIFDHGFAMIHRSIAIKGVKEIRKNGALSVLKTCILTLFVVVIFINILSDADPIFAEMVKTFREQIGERGFFTLLIILGLSFALSFKVKKADLTEKNFNWLSFQDLFWSNLAVTILFGIFAFVQWKYLFAGEANFHKLDVTYSDYVRKGFVETLVATLLGGVLGYITTLVARDDEGHKQKWLLRGINTILIIEMVGMLVSAWMRNDIYIETYGITRTRIAGNALISWLGALLAAQLVFTWAYKLDEKHMLIWMSAFTIGTVGYLNLINMDMQIANSKPGVDGRDYFYAAHLSADAYPAWAETEEEAFNFYQSIYNKQTPWTEEEQKKLATFRIATHIIDEQYLRLQTMKDHIFFWNWSKNQAILNLKESGRDEKHACVLDGFDRIIITQRLSDIPGMEWDRMNNYEYPFTSRTFGERFTYYPQYEDDIYNRILGENEDLKKEFNEQFGEYNQWGFEEKFKEYPEWKAKFLPFIKPKSCAL